jgi:subtilisin-like proprotein convertase family protein
LGKNLYQFFSIFAFAGKTSGGTWKLRIYDGASSKTGKLDYWRLDVEGAMTRRTAIAFLV